jgi:predicted HAD superfamily phosphohydrolase YqeG
MRQLVANNSQKIINREATQKGKRTTLQMKHHGYEKKIINNIKTQMIQNHLIITKADKDNTLVTMHEHEYNEKVEEFISNNNFTKLSQDITNNKNT